MYARRAQLGIVLLKGLACARRALRRAVAARLQRCAQNGCAAAHLDRSNWEEHAGELLSKSEIGWL